MPIKVSAQTWKAKIAESKRGNGFVDECHVPPLLGIVLRLLWVAGVAPVRLRRAHDGWLLSMSPRLVVFQRLFIISIGVTVIAALVLDFRSKGAVSEFNVSSITSIMWLIEAGLMLGTCVQRVLHAPRSVQQLMVILKQTREVNNGLHSNSNSSIRAQRNSKVWLISYLIWIFAIHLFGVYETQFYQGDCIIIILYGSYYYMSILMGLLKLQWNFTIMAIISNHTALNNQLQHLLASAQKNSNTLNPIHGYLTIRHFGHCYELICDMVAHVEKDSEIFLIFVFILSFEFLLMSPCYFILSIVLRDRPNSIYNNLYITLGQGARCLFQVRELLVVAEPCHQMQNETARTQYLLSRLVRHAGAGNDRVTRELELFLLQVQTRGPEVAPLGMFSISRNVPASIIGYVATYVIVVVQMQMA